jgi:hypothetical protein
VKLTTFILELSGDQAETEESEDQEINATYGKLTKYNATQSWQSVVKMAAFLIIFALRIPRNMIKNQLQKERKIIKWKIYFVHTQNMLEFMTFNSSLIGASFPAAVQYLYRIRMTRVVKLETMLFSFAYLFFASIYLFELIYISIR